MLKETLILIFAAGTLAAQMPQDYLDIYTAKVKMGKRADFDAMNKKEVEMNRKNGDRWLAYETVFGDPSNVSFISRRANYADAEKGVKLFGDALKRGLGGEAAATKWGSEFDGTLDAAHESIYRQRWDLSGNAPKGAEELNRLVGHARWLFISITQIRPGMQQAYEAELRLNKEAAERSDTSRTSLVSQGGMGGDAGVYRTVFLFKSLAEMDSLKNIAQLRPDSLANYRKVQQEAVERQETIIARYLPEISNPPDDIAAVDPSFWRPKPAAPPKPAAKQ